jgi:hypothetical protein
MYDDRYDDRADGLGFLLHRSIILAIALLVVGSLLFKNAKRLKTWMDEVKALLAKEDMRASLRPGSSRQSIGDIQAGRDVSVSQEITNHYNHRPDDPKLAIIVAIIGAVAVIVSAWLGKGH